MDNSAGDESKGKATVTLPAALTEPQKAGARLAYAATMHTMSCLQGSANMIASLCDVDDLSFRRGGGRIDIALSEDKAFEALTAAAVAFTKVSEQEQRECVSSEDSETEFRKLKNWVDTVNQESARDGVPPDVQNGADAFVALGAMLRWCEEHPDAQVRREMAIAVRAVFR